MLEGSDYDWLEEFKQLEHDDMKREIQSLEMYLPNTWKRKLTIAYCIVSTLGGLLLLFSMGIIFPGDVALTSTVFLTAVGAFVWALTGMFALHAYDKFTDDPVSIIISKRETIRQIEGGDWYWGLPTEKAVRERVEKEKRYKHIRAKEEKIQRAIDSGNQYAVKNAYDELTDAKKLEAKTNWVEIRAIKPHDYRKSLDRINRQIASMRRAYEPY